MEPTPGDPVETSAHPHDRDREDQPDLPWAVFAARVLPDARSAGRWVDLGCARGEFLARAAASGLRGFGLDFWLPNAAAARAAGRPSLVADLNRPLPFRDASLDGASLVEVLEHIVRAEDLAAELARVLRPGGWLLLTTPNVAHVALRWRAVTGHPPKQEGYHYRFFTRSLLAETLTRAGFRRVAAASFGKQALLTRLARLAGRPRAEKVRYVVPPPLESLLAQHFVWRLERGPGSSLVG